MEGTNEEIQAKLLDPDVISLWERLGRYARGRMGLLLYLNQKEEPVKVGDLATSLGVSMPRVSSMIHRLETLRLIRRAKRKEDQRSTYVELTPLGKEKTEEIAARQSEVIQQISDRVGEETLRRFLDDAKTIQLVIDDIIQEDPSCCD